MRFLWTVSVKSDSEYRIRVIASIRRYKRSLVVVSHSQDFMNGVCTNVIHLFQKKLVYYGVSANLCECFTEKHTYIHFYYGVPLVSHISWYFENDGKG